jgi:hypothetical protein
VSKTLGLKKIRAAKANKLSHKRVAAMTQLSTKVPRKNKKVIKE